MIVHYVHFTIYPYKGQKGAGRIMRVTQVLADIWLLCRSKGRKYIFLLID